MVCCALGSRDKPGGDVEYERRRRDDTVVFRVLRSATSPPEPGSSLSTPVHFDGGLTLTGFNWLGERYLAIVDDRPAEDRILVVPHR
jgi:hypothetical protein